VAPVVAALPPVPGDPVVTPVVSTLPPPAPVVLLAPPSPPEPTLVLEVPVLELPPAVPPLPDPDVALPSFDPRASFATAASEMELSASPASEVDAAVMSAQWW
jgi:hypothetical protein